MTNRLTEVAPFGDGETTASNCSRIAAACGYDSASSFARSSGFSFKNLAEGNRADVERFAQAIDRSRAYVERGLVRTEARIVSIGGERLMSRQMFRLTPRFCPVCLAEDEAAGPGRLGARAYGRLNWQVLAVRTCSIHHVELAAPEYLESFKYNHDFSALVRMMPRGLDWYRDQARTMSPDGLQVYVEARLAGRSDGSLWPDEMPLHDAVSLAEILGAVLRHGAEYRSSLLDVEEWSRCADDGFGILKSGEASFREFIYALLKRDYLPREFAKRRSLLGRLYDLLYFSVEDFDGIVRRIIRDAVAETNAAPSSQPSESTSRVSVSAAAERFGVDRLRLRKLLRDGLAITSEQAFRNPSRIIVDEPLAERYADELKRTMDGKEARTKLGASPHVFNALVSRAILAPQEQAAERQLGVNFMVRFRSADVEAILSRLHAVAQAGHEADGMVSIPLAARKSGTSIRDVVASLLEGSYRQAILVTRGGGFQDVRLDVEEIRANFFAIGDGLMSVKAASEKVGAPAKVVAGLVKQGSLPKVRKRNPDTRMMGDYLDVGAVDRFCAEFVTLSRLADMRKVSKPRLREELAAEEIEPAFAMFDTSFYRRSELPID